MISSYVHALAPFLVAFFLKTTVLLLLAWIVAFLLRKKSAAVRHAIWAAAILSSLALPLVTLLLPSWRSSTIAAAAAPPTLTPAGPPPTQFQRLQASVVRAVIAPPVSDVPAVAIAVVWLLGSLLLLSRLAVGFLRVSKIAERLVPLDRADAAQILARLQRLAGTSRSVLLAKGASELSMPITWGLRYPRILFPVAAETWSPERLFAVLSHEFAHVARRDWPLVIAAELFRSVFWPNPFARLAVRRLRHESEQACDDFVLSSGVDPSAYASHLFDLVRSLKRPQFAGIASLAFARPTNLERRFVAMLDSSTDRRSLSSRRRTFAVIAALCILLPLATLRLPAQSLSGKLYGTVRDALGNPLPNATVVLFDHAFNAEQMTGSGADGNFTLQPVPPGDYRLAVAKDGFATFHASSLSLAAGRDTSQSVVLVAASPDAQHAEKAVPVAGDVQAAKLVKKVMPVYPEAAKKAGIQGTVTLHAIIDKNAKPESLRVVNTEIDPALARSAIEAVSHWRYSTTLLNGKPVAVETTVQIVYSLAP